MLVWYKYLILYEAMNEPASMVAATKKLLKKNGLTYRDVAKSLKLSEPSVKRMFATGRLTVDRLAQVCELFGFTLAELAQEAQADRQRLRTLTVSQEEKLVSDTKLLLTAVCALNHWTMPDILSAYDLSETECVRCLLELDRMRLIALLPGNRIRLVVARDFDWLSGGPIRKFFRTKGLDDFLGSLFSEKGESMEFVHGMFTDAAFEQLQQELLKVRKRFAELHEESLAAPLIQRHGASLLFATRRSWELAAFAALKWKKPKT